MDRVMNEEVRRRAGIESVQKSKVDRSESIEMGWTRGENGCVPQG